MATSTAYTDLKNTVQKYLNQYDEDTLTFIPSFINTAEKSILRNLRMPSMEKMVQFTLKDAGDNDYPVVEGLSQPNEWVRVPIDFIEMKAIWDATDALESVDFKTYLSVFNSTSACKKPVFCINAGRLFVAGVDQDTVIRMTYYADLPELSDDNAACHPLITLMPGALTYQSVAEGFRFMMEEERAAIWEQKAQQLVDKVQMQCDAAEYKGGTLRIRTKR